MGEAAQPARRDSVGDPLMDDGDCAGSEVPRSPSPRHAHSVAFGAQCHAVRWEIRAGPGCGAARGGHILTNALPRSADRRRALAQCVCVCGKPEAILVAELIFQVPMRSAASRRDLEKRPGNQNRTQRNRTSPEPERGAPMFMRKLGGWNSGTARDDPHHRHLVEGYP